MAPLWLFGACLLAPAADAWPQTPGALDSRSIHETPEEEAKEAEHAPRHGGHFGDADDLYHYEVLLEPSARLILYVNDEHNEPLDVRPLTGRWTLNPDGPTPVTGTFHPEDSGRYFFAALPALADADPVHMKVEVLKGDAWAGMEFYLPRPSELVP